MKLDQVAYYCSNEKAEQTVKEMFGLTKAEWLPDTVMALSSVEGGPWEDNVAQLQFNYDLGIELELIRYTAGNHWHKRPFGNPLPVWPFISHVGIHLEDHEDFPERPNLVQETKTLCHTATYLTTGPGVGRKYHYKIFRIDLLQYVKYIKRIHP